ncbi:MAG: hypothetical protein CMM00_00705 [Rhodopirellula sp.]|nr:hypothetical protein [Rhodopirellula sp.]
MTIRASRPDANIAVFPKGWLDSLNPRPIATGRIRSTRILKRGVAEERSFAEIGAGAFRAVGD